MAPFRFTRSDELEGAEFVEVDLRGARLPDGEAGRVLADLATRPSVPGRKRIVLRFLTAPVRVVGGSRARGLEVTGTRLVERDGRVVAESAAEDIDEHRVLDLVMEGQPLAVGARPA